MSEPTKTGRGANGQGGFLDTKFLADLCDTFGLIPEDAQVGDHLSDASLKSLDDDLYRACLGYVLFVEPYKAAKAAVLRKELERVETCVKALDEALGNLSHVSRLALRYAGAGVPWMLPRELEKAIRPRRRKPTRGKIAAKMKALFEAEGQSIPLSAVETFFARFVGYVLEDLRKSDRLCDDPVPPDLLQKKLQGFLPSVDEALGVLSPGKGRTPKQGGAELLYEALAMVFLHHLPEGAYKAEVEKSLGTGLNGKPIRTENAELSGTCVHDCRKFVDCVLEELKRRGDIVDSASMSDNQKTRAVRRAADKFRVNASAPLSDNLRCVLLAGA